MCPLATRSSLSSACPWPANSKRRRDYLGKPVVYVSSSAACHYLATRIATAKEVSIGKIVYICSGSGEIRNRIQSQAKLEKYRLSKNPTQISLDKGSSKSITRISNTLSNPLSWKLFQFITDNSYFSFFNLFN